MTLDPEEFTTRYVQMWNEPDPHLRTEIVRQLWSATGLNYTRSIEAHGHDAIVGRVNRAYET